VQAVETGICLHVVQAVTFGNAVEKQSEGLVSIVERDVRCRKRQPLALARPSQRKHLSRRVAPAHTGVNTGDVWPDAGPPAQHLVFFLLESKRFVVPAHLFINVRKPVIVSRRPRLEIDGLLQMRYCFIEFVRAVQNPAKTRLDGLFSVSATGTLVSRQTSAEQTQLTWFDRGGKALGTLGPVGDYWGIQLSPDNRRAAAVLHRTLSGYFAIWLIDIARNISTPFSLESERSLAPAWAPDSTRVYFASTSRHERIFSKAVDDVNAERVLSSPGKVIEPLDVSPDGRYLLGALVDSPGTPQEADVLGGWEE
jgi:WD40 repeat protein